MNTVRINTCPNGNRLITIDEEWLCATDLALLKEQGKTFSELAKSDPSAAYDYLRWGIGRTAALVTADISLDDRVLAVRLLDGHERTVDIAERTVDRLLPASFEASFDVIVTVANDNISLIPEQGTAPETFWLRVGPPDLAA